MTCFTPLNVIIGLVAPDQLDVACHFQHISKMNFIPTPFVTYALVFLLNCALETPAYQMAGWCLRRSVWTIVGQTVAVNLTTHPVVFYVFPLCGAMWGWSSLSTIALAEALAFSVEMVLLRGVWRYAWWAAIVAATAANLTSWWVGELLYDAGLTALLW
jgi:hypothetical protein